MLLKKFKFKKVNSTNDIAINLIKKIKKTKVLLFRIFKKKEEEGKAINGFHLKEIYLFRYFLK